MEYTSHEVYEYISRQTDDPIVQWKVCVISDHEFAIYQSDLDFYNTISPSFSNQKFPVPTPSLCPEERQRRRLAFRNERKLYKRRCDATGEQIISIYSPDKPYKIYNQKYRRSDARDPLSYGKEFDFNKTFTENFRELSIQVPRCNVIIQNCENSNYTNYSADNKDCYLSVSSHRCKNLLFSYRCHDSIDCLDCIDVNHSTDCYQSIDCENCNDISYSRLCNNCSKSLYLENCIGCSFCMFCINLNNNTYYILNKQYDKEQYIAISKEIKRDKILFEKYYKEYILLRQNTVISATNIIESENCIGNFLHNCNHGRNIFYMQNTSYTRYSYDGRNVKTSGDTTNPDDLEGCYENASSINNYNTLFSYHIGRSSNLYYCDFTMNSNDCFGCISLNRKSYCIFNKQYTKEEYETQVAKIIAHMQNTGERGEFFHPSLSPFGYNETVAQEYFSFDQLESERISYSRSHYSSDPKIPEGIQTFCGDEIASDITTVSDDIIKKVLICEISQRPYMIQKAELEFYRKHYIPLPRKHPDIRHEERMKMRPGRTLYLRTCDKCKKEIISVYPLQHPSNIYCEGCYTKEIYG